MRKLLVWMYIIGSVMLICSGHWIIGGLLFIDAIDTPFNTPEPIVLPELVDYSPDEL